MYTLGIRAGLCLGHFPRTGQDLRYEFCSILAALFPFERNSRASSTKHMSSDRTTEFRTLEGKSLVQTTGIFKTQPYIYDSRALHDDCSAHARILCSPSLFIS